MKEESTHKPKSKICIEIANVKYYNSGEDTNEAGNGTSNRDSKKDLSIGTGPSRKASWSRKLSAGIRINTKQIIGKGGLADYATFDQLHHLLKPLEKTLLEKSIKRYYSTKRGRSKEKAVSDAVKADLTRIFSVRNSYNSVLKIVKTILECKEKKLQFTYKPKQTAYGMNSLQVHRSRASKTTIFCDKMIGTTDVNNTAFIEDSNNSSLCCSKHLSNKRHFSKSPAPRTTTYLEDDTPKSLQRNKRIRNIRVTQLRFEQDTLHKRFVLNHPVMKLLERNYSKLKVHEIFLRDNKALYKLREYCEGVPMIETEVKSHPKFINNRLMLLPSISKHT